MEKKGSEGTQLKGDAIASQYQKGSAKSKLEFKA
jgi:hypothetical protein